MSRRTVRVGLAEAEHRAHADVVFTGTVLARRPPAEFATLAVAVGG